MNIQRVTPMIAVSNIEQALKLYSDLLGAQVTNRHEENGQLVWCSVQAGDTNLMFQRHPGQAQKNGGTVFYFYTDNIEALHHSLQSAGYSVTDVEAEPGGRKECEMTDVDGNILMFAQNVNS
jgi:uncharacterized glyoxalase superfamily protein PhnB